MSYMHGKLGYAPLPDEIHLFLIKDSIRGQPDSIKDTANECHAHFKKIYICVFIF